MENELNELAGKMELYILYDLEFRTEDGILVGNRFERRTNDEQALKEFIEELLKLQADGMTVRVVEVINNLGY